MGKDSSSSLRAGWESEGQTVKEVWVECVSVYPQRREERVSSLLSPEERFSSLLSPEERVCSLLSPDERVSSLLTSVLLQVLLVAWLVWAADCQHLPWLYSFPSLTYSEVATFCF